MSTANFHQRRILKAVPLTSPPTLYVPVTPPPLPSPPLILQLTTQRQASLQGVIKGILLLVAIIIAGLVLSKHDGLPNANEGKNISGGAVFQDLSERLAKQ